MSLYKKVRCHSKTLGVQTRRVRHRTTPMSYLAPRALVVSLALSGGALAQERSAERGAWDITLSAGVISAPAWLGGNDYQTSVLPNLMLNYKDRLSMSFRGISYTAISRGGWVAGPVLSYDSGRKENIDDSPFALSTDHSTELKGLGDVEGTLQIGGFLEYEARSYTARLALHQGIDGGHGGLSGEASIGYRGQSTAVGRPVLYTIGPAISFADDAFNSAFFDTSASQSEASGISPFDAHGGLNSVGLHASIFMPLSRTLSLVGFAQIDRLTGDVADSSIVTERGSEDQITTGAFVNYRF